MTVEEAIKYVEHLGPDDCRRSVTATAAMVLADHIKKSGDGVQFSTSPKHPYGFDHAVV